MRWVILIITLLVVGSAGFGAGWAVNEWRNDDGDGAGATTDSATPTPEETTPQLSKVEVEIRAQEFLQSRASEHVRDVGDVGKCSAIEFDADTRNWLVRCACNGCAQTQIGRPGFDATIWVHVPDFAFGSRIRSCAPSWVC